MHRARTVLGLLIIAASVFVSSHAQQPPPATIRTGITSVPIDVRVVDRNGKPVTDLTREDFTILEEGVPQQIRHFATQAFAADPSAALPEPRFRTTVSGPVPATENRRVFLILIGRGRHQSASKYVDALTRFLTERILPQDQVALFAWNRATDFTTNREILPRTLARYLEEHERIEMDLREWFSGLRAVYGAKDIPPHVQRRIDSVFEEARALRARPLAPGAAAGQRTIDDMNRRNLDKSLSAATERLEGGSPEQTAESLNVTFDQHAAKVTETMQDIGNLYAGIDYLRRLDGEKHLLLLTERGVTVPRSDRNLYVNLARAASDARIALDIIHTGGTDAGHKQPMAQSFAVGDLRVMADLTGGQMAAYRTGDDSFRRLEDANSFQYVLAYYPSSPVRDGKYRKVSVKVNRPDALVMHRQGYFATDRLVPMDRREFVTSSRIDAAAQFRSVIDHLAVTVNEAAVGGGETDRAATTRVTVDVSRVKFTRAADHHTATLDVALFCGDDKNRIVGQIRQQVNLTLTDARLERALKEGVAFNSRVPIAGHARTLKVIVYDYGADLIGSAVAKIR
jgi:VWFA-related protein